MDALNGSLPKRSQEAETTILLLEDDPVDRLAIQRRVEKESLPWTLRCAGTVADGIRCAGEGGLDLAILDHRLPDGTAFDILGHLGETPYVFITGGRETAVAVRAMKGGASDFLLKDDERRYLELLPTVVRSALDLCRLRREARRHQEELELRVEERTREARDAERRLRALASRQVALGEEERRSFAREIHDELGQLLTGLRMDLAVLRSEVVERDRQTAARVAECLGTIDQSIDLVRGLSSRLHPPILDILGLGPALEWLVDDSRGRSPARLNLDMAEIGPGLAKPHALSLYRIAQEALSNALRHSKARNVEVTLHQEGAEYVL